MRKLIVKIKNIFYPPKSCSATILIFSKLEGYADLVILSFTIILFSRKVEFSFGTSGATEFRVGVLQHVKQHSNHE